MPALSLLGGKPHLGHPCAGGQFLVSFHGYTARRLSGLDSVGCLTDWQGGLHESTLGVATTHIFRDICCGLSNTCQ